MGAGEGHGGVGDLVLATPTYFCEFSKGSLRRVNIEGDNFGGNFGGVDNLWVSPGNMLAIQLGPSGNPCGYLPATCW